MAQPQAPNLSEELVRVTGDRVVDLGVLSQSAWFVFNPAAVNTTAITADPVGYVAYGLQYFGVSVDWTAVELWERTAEQLDVVTAGMLTGVRGAEDVRTLDALFDAVTTLTTYLTTRAPLFEDWVASAGVVDAGLGGTAVDVITATLDRYTTTLQTWRDSLKTASGVPLAAAVDNARVLLRRFNSDVAGAWNDARGQGLRERVRTGIDTAIAAVAAHLVSGGIVLGTPGYLFDSWDPATNAVLPVTPAEVATFQARVRAQILTTLASYPAGNLQSAETWTAINRAITASVAPLIQAVSAIAGERRAALETGYADLTTGLVPSSGLGAPPGGQPGSDELPPSAGGNGAGAGADGTDGTDGAAGGADPATSLAQVTVGGGEPGGSANGGANGGPGDPANDGSGGAPAVVGDGSVGGVTADTDLALDVTSAGPLPGGSGASGAFGAPEVFTGDTDSEFTTVVPIGGVVGRAGGDVADEPASPGTAGVPLTLPFGLTGGAGSADDEDDGAAPPLTLATAAISSAVPGFVGGNAGLTATAGSGPSLTVPALPGAGLSDPAVAMTNGNLPGWDGRVGGDGRAGLPRPTVPIMLPASPASAYQSPGFWPPGLYGPSSTQVAGSPVAYGTAGRPGPGIGGSSGSVFDDRLRARERASRLAPSGGPGGQRPVGGDPDDRFRPTSGVGREPVVRPTGAVDPDRSRSGGAGPVNSLRPPGAASHGSGRYGLRPGQELDRGRVVPGDGDENWSPDQPGRRPDGVVGPADDEAPDTFASVAMLGLPMLVGAAGRRRDEDDDEDYRDRRRRGLADGVVDDDAGDDVGGADGGEEA